MNIQEEVTKPCPYCSQPVSFLIDRSTNEQEYTEDCQTCCSPMLVRVEIDEGNQINLIITKEND